MKDEGEEMERSHQSSQDMNDRTKKFALRIIRLFAALPKTTEAQVIGKQLLRSGVSVGAHYREAKRARSTAEFTSKLEVGLQELEETGYWIELLVDTQIISKKCLQELQNEIEELTAILITIVKNAKNQKLTNGASSFCLHPSAFILS